MITGWACIPSKFPSLRNDSIRGCVLFSAGADGDLAQWVLQQWLALLTNRTRRHRAGEFLMQGVRPISLDVEHDWVIRALLYDMSGPLSRWAADLLGRLDTRRVAIAPEFAV